MGILLVQYLALPLVTTRLKHSNCQPLIKQILAKIRLMTSTSLTYIGKLHLIKSVLFSIQVYWSSMFILPATTVRKIEGILQGFLLERHDQGGLSISLLPSERKESTD